MGAPRGQNVIRGRSCLQHQVHAANEVTGEAPIAARFKITEGDVVGEAEFDLGSGVSDLAGDEFETAARTLMIEEDRRAGEERVPFAVETDHGVSVDLGDAVRTARIERRGL